MLALFGASLGLRLPMDVTVLSDDWFIVKVEYLNPDTTLSVVLKYLPFTFLNFDYYHPGNDLIHLNLWMFT